MSPSEIGTNIDEFIMEFDTAIYNCILFLAQLPSTLKKDPGGVPWLFFAPVYSVDTGRFGDTYPASETACMSPFPRDFVPLPGV